MADRTNAEILAILGTDSTLNQVRRVFSSWSARIEQAGQQRRAMNPFELRRMEIEAAEALIAACAEPLPAPPRAGGEK